MRKILFILSLFIVGILTSGTFPHSEYTVLYHALDSLAKKYGSGDFEVIKKYCLSDPNFVKNDSSDTIYLYVNSSFGNYGWFQIWNRHHRYSNYLYMQNRKLTFSNGLRFALIERWDTATLRKLSQIPEKIEWRSECPNCLVFRIIISGMKFGIDSFHSSNYFSIRKED